MTLKKQVLSGVKWTTIGTIALAVTAILKISILARFLDKTDFGLIALVTFVMGFMELFNDMGLTSAILHKQKISKTEYASLYWFNLLVSFLMYGILLVLTPFVSSFYGEPELNKLIPLLGLNLILSGIGRQFKIIEQKKLLFKEISLVDMITAVLSLGLAVVLAVKGFGVFSLVYSALFQYVVSNVIFFIIGFRKQGLLLHFKYQETKPFLKIGIYQVGGQVVNYFNRDLDILLIGKFFGTDILGGYSLAKQLIRRPIQIINPIISKIGVSVFPKYQNDHASLKKYFMKLFNAFGPLNALIYGSIAIFAPYIVRIFYGPDFMSIVFYVQLFSGVIYLRSMAGIVGILVVTKGRTDYELYWNLITTLILPVAIFVGALHSLELIIILIGITQLGFLVPAWYMFFKRLIDLSFLPFIKAHIYPLLIAVGSFSLSQLINMNHFVGAGLSGFLLLLALTVYSYLTLEEFRNYLFKICTKYARI